MTGFQADLDAQHGGLAAQPHWSDTQVVQSVFQFLLLGRDFRIWMDVVQITHERLLCKLGSMVESSANTNSDNRRRARVRTGFGNTVDHEILDSFPPLCRSQHGDATHVLGTTALGHENYLQPVAGNHVKMDNGRSVIAGIDPSQRITR